MPLAIPKPQSYVCSPKFQETRGRSRSPRRSRSNACMVRASVQSVSVMAASIVNLANVTVALGKAVTKALPHPPPPSPDESPTLPFDSTEKEKREGEEQKGLPDGKQGKDCSANFCPRCGLQIGGSSSSGHWQGNRGSWWSKCANHWGAFDISNDNWWGSSRSSSSDAW